MSTRLSVIQASSADSVAERLRREDAAALTEAYRSFRAPLIRYAARYVGIAPAHDVVQDVFISLWERRRTLTVEVSLQALLYTMTRNRALNLNRRSARIDTEVEVGEARDGQGEGRMPDSELQAKELGRHLRRWIEALPPRRAEAFTLSRFHALSHAEIANVMGLSVRTVDTHIVHALRDLRRRLDTLH